MSNPYLQRLASLPRPEHKGTAPAISLFCGGGGLDLGLSMAGFDIVFSSDNVESHCQTISANFPDAITHVSDARELTADLIRQRTGISEFELVAGGPPCQAFSILGKRGSFGDSRGQLVYDFVKLVSELNPRTFLFENVPGILSLNKGADWKQLLSFISTETGYTLKSTILNSADFGIPQIRKRLFIAGFRSEQVPFTFPVDTHRNPNLDSDLFTQGLPEWIPSKYALTDVDGVPNQRVRVHGDRVKNRYMLLAPGQRDKTDHTDRVDPNRPSGTVIVGSRAGGGRPHIHPFEPRHITVREAARLQSFPDWYIFQGTETWQYRAVGNAVPPILAKAIGEALLSALDRE